MGFLTNIKSLDEVPQFEVIKEPLFDSRNEPIPNLFSLMRTDSREHLGSCTNSYRPIQMNEMIETIKVASKAAGDIEHIGYTTSSSGKKVLIQSKIGNFGLTDDPIEGIFYTIIDNSGKSANMVIPSTMRISCDNALHLVRYKHKESTGNTRNTSLRHNYNFDERVEMFVTNIQSNIETVKNFQTIANRLRDQPFTKDKMVLLSHKLMPKQDDESTKRVSKRSCLISKFGNNGRANEGKTKWDALNAVTEFESHQKFTPAKLIRTLTASTMSTQALEILQGA